MTAYTHGAHQLTDRVHVYLQPNGTWGLSNSGLVQGERSSLLVDTLFDAPLTRSLLDGFEAATRATPIRYAVNTHGDGDHWFGNHQLPTDTQIISSKAAIEDMEAMTPAALAQVVSSDLPEPLGPFAKRIFGAFAFDRTEPRMPTDTFTGAMQLDVDGTTVNLIEVGPAHTLGDTLVHVPGERTVFAGDTLFIGGTPILWDGPIENWIAALDRILELDVDHIVPGHGPLTDRDGVRFVRRYLTYVRDQTKERFDAGMAPMAAAWDIELGEFADLIAPERIVVTVDRLYHQFDPERPLSEKVPLFGAMATWLEDHRPNSS